MKKLPAYPVYLTISGVQGFLFWLVVTVSLVYHATVVGMNPLQLVLVGSVLELSIFIFEIPTGVMADAYSRRRSVIIGYALIGLGFIVEGAFPRFETVLLAQVIWGVGFTFTSGAKEAWISEEIGEQKAGRAFLRGVQVGQATALLGMAVSVALASIQLNVPILVGGGLFFFLVAFLLLFMPETDFKKVSTDKLKLWASTKATFIQGLRVVRSKRVLMLIFIIVGIYSMTTETFDRLWTRHVLDIGLPDLGGLDSVVWFGLINATSMILGIIVTEWVKRRVDTNTHEKVAKGLFIINMLVALGIVLFALSTEFWWAILAFWIPMSLRGNIEPLVQAWVNQSTRPEVRATVFSMQSQSFSLGQVFGGPILGQIGNVVSVSFAIMISGVLMILMIPFYLMSLKFKQEK